MGPRLGSNYEILSVTWLDNFKNRYNIYTSKFYYDIYGYKQSQNTSWHILADFDEIFVDERTKIDLFIALKFISVRRAQAEWSTSSFFIA